MRESPPIQWTDAMSVGDEALDREHRELIELVNLLGEACERADRGALLDRVNQLLNMARLHFRNEEQMLARVGYPEQARHAREHEQMMERIVTLTDLASHGEISPRVLQLLRDWLIEHVFDHDKPYVSFLKENRPR